MTSKTEIPEITEDIVVNTLPPVICNNPRKRIDPEEVDSNDIKLRCKETIRSDAQLVDYPTPKPPPPIPKFPLSIVWNPGHLYYELNEDPVRNTLSICNGCPRTIYIHCCGLWDETARLGASWFCNPRIRFHLAPGMVSRLVVTATPRNQSPVPLAYAGLQLAAAHMRDNVVGYFVVPIVVRFLNYKPPFAGEGE